MANDLAVFEQRLESEKRSILDRLPKLNEWLTEDRWWQICYELSRRGKLLAVARENPDSLIDALKKLAAWGLEPDGDEAFINVYNEKQVVNGKDVWLPTASAEPMYKGLLRRAVEAGVVAHAVPEVIREGDAIEEVADLKGRHIVHKRAFNAKPNRPLVGAFCLFWLTNGLMDYELFDADDIERVKAAALRLAQRGNKDAKLSPAWQFSPGEMAKKSVLKRGLKRMRGKRGDSKALDAYQQILDDTQRNFDVETTAEEAPDDTPRPVAVVKDADGQDGKRVEGSHAGSERAGGPPPPTDRNAPRSGGAETKHDDPFLDDAAQAEVIAFAKQHKIKMGVLTQQLYDYAQVEDLSELKVSQLPEFLAQLEKFA